MRIVFEESFHEDLSIITAFSLTIAYGDQAVAEKYTIGLMGHIQHQLSNPVFHGTKRIIVNDLEYAAVLIGGFWVIFEEHEEERRVLHIYHESMRHSIW